MMFLRFLYGQIVKVNTNNAKNTGSGRFIELILCPKISIFWVIFDIYNVSVAKTSYLFTWLVTSIAKDTSVLDLKSSQWCCWRLPCRLVNNFQRFEGSCCLYVPRYLFFDCWTLKISALRMLERSAFTNRPEVTSQTTRIFSFVYFPLYSL
jgi:hypothetical protein